MISRKMKQMVEQSAAMSAMFTEGKRLAAIYGAENVYDFGIGNPNVKAPASVNATAIEILQNMDSLKVHSYTDSSGIPAARKAIAESLNRRFGTNYDESNLVMTVGAAGGLNVILKVLLDAGDEVLTFAPFFPEYHPYVDLTGAVLKVVPADTKSFQINFEAFEEMLGPRVAAVLVNTPNNPSGAVYSAETLTKLAEVLTRKAEQYGHDIFLISDEPYREIVFDGKQQPYVSKFYANTISCYSFSKALSLPGERIGYLAVNPACPYAAEIVNMCGQISRGIGHNCPTSLMQLAVSKVLDLTSDFSVYEKNRNLLYECLTDCGFEVVKPEGTFYIFPKAPEADAAAFCQKALQYDLVLVPADSFGCPGYFRMAYCIDTEKVERSLPVLRKMMKEIYG